MMANNRKRNNYKIKTTMKWNNNADCRSSNSSGGQSPEVPNKIYVIRLIDIQLLKEPYFYTMIGMFVVLWRPLPPIRGVNLLRLIFIDCV